MKTKYLCSDASLEVEHDKHVHAYYCGVCRTWGSGATFSLIAAKPPKVDGGENTARYHSSEWAERAFCKNCGTHLFYHFLPSDSYFVFAELFADNADFILGEQILIDAKAPYYELANDTPKLAEEEFLAQLGGG